MTSEFKVGDRVKSRLFSDSSFEVLDMSESSLWVRNLQTNRKIMLWIDDAVLDTTPPTPPLPEKVWLYKDDNRRWHATTCKPDPTVWDHIIELHPRQEVIDRAGWELLLSRKLSFCFFAGGKGHEFYVEGNAHRYPDLRSAVLALRPELAELVGEGGNT